MDLLLRFPRLLLFVMEGGAMGGGKRGWNMSGLGIRDSGGSGSVGDPSSGGGGVGG